MHLSVASCLQSVYRGLNFAFFMFKNLEFNNTLFMLFLEMLLPNLECPYRSIGIQCNSKKHGFNVKKNTQYQVSQYQMKRKI